MVRKRRPIVVTFNACFVSAISSLRWLRPYTSQDQQIVAKQQLALVLHSIHDSPYQHDRAEDTNADCRPQYLIPSIWPLLLCGRHAAHWEREGGLRCQGRSQANIGSKCATAGRTQRFKERGGKGNGLLITTSSSVRPGFSPTGDLPCKVKPRKHLSGFCFA